MGVVSSMEARKYIKKLIKHSEGPYCLLLLPTNEWAAFWFTDLGCCHVQAVFEGNYLNSCAFIGNKTHTIEYVLRQLEEIYKQDPINSNYNVNKIRKKLFRSNSKLNKFN
jgi:hypothetical protein